MLNVTTEEWEPSYFIHVSFLGKGGRLIGIRTNIVLMCMTNKL